MDNKFKKDVSWNMISFIIIGISGILLNILIGRYYGAQFLGTFNLIFAMYILLSQIAVFGIHLSVLKYISHNDDEEELSIIISSALYLTSFTAIVVTIVSLFLSDFIGFIFSSKLVASSWIYIAIGLFFFAMNKVLLNIFNAKREMKFYALTQALRYILALAIMILFIIYNIDGVKLGLLISISEIILFLILLGKLSKVTYLSSIKASTLWFKKHYKFGHKSLVGGVMTEINTRVDIIVLGVFVSESMVGVYTIALMIFEGFVQLAMVLRNNYNPIISKLFNEKKFNELSSMINKGKNKFYIVMFVLIMISFMIYPYFVKIFLGEDFLASVDIYYILMIGVILSSGYLPFEMLLSQCGFPKQQSIFKSFVVFGNFVLNFILISLYGLIGAAIATALVYVISIFLLKLYSAKYLKIKI